MVTGKKANQEDWNKWEASNFYLKMMSSNRDNQEVEIMERIESAARLYQSSKNPLIGKKKISRKVKLVSVHLGDKISRTSIGNNKNGQGEERARKKAALELRWFSHLIRMKNDVIVTKVWESKIQRKKTREKPART